MVPFALARRRSSQRRGYRGSSGSGARMLCATLTPSAFGLPFRLGRHSSARWGSTARAKTDRARAVPRCSNTVLRRPVARASSVRSRSTAQQPTGRGARSTAQPPDPRSCFHWWRGDPAQTLEAVELGCFFSINGSRGTKSPRILDSRDLSTDCSLRPTSRTSRRYDRAGDPSGESSRRSRHTSKRGGKPTGFRLEASYGTTSVRCSQQRRSSIECPAGSSRRSRPPATEAGDARRGGSLLQRQPPEARYVVALRDPDEIRLLARLRSPQRRSPAWLVLPTAPRAANCDATLRELRLPLGAESTKWRMLRESFDLAQRRDGHAGSILRFVKQSLDPANELAAGSLSDLRTSVDGDSVAQRP